MRKYQGKKVTNNNHMIMVIVAMIQLNGSSIFFIPQLIDLTAVYHI